MGRFTILTETADGDVAVRRLGRHPDVSEAEELAAIRLYFEAHALLPPEPAPLDEAGLALWAAVLSDPDARTELLLEGLILLAHTPHPKALEVLRGYAASPHAGFEILSELARDECELWLERADRGAAHERSAHVTRLASA